MCRTVVLALLLMAMVVPAPLVVAGSTTEIEHITTTFRRDDAPASGPMLAEMLCCHCYKPYRDGSRSYQGVLEAGFCRSQGCYCEGFAKCFP